MLRILVVDDHPLTRRTVSSLLKLRPDFHIVGEATDGFEAVGQAERLQPDIIILDISLPGLNGIDATRQISRVSPNSRVLFLSHYAGPRMIHEALRVGAIGYVAKTDAGGELLKAIGAVAEDEPFVSSSCLSDTA